MFTGNHFIWIVICLVIIGALTFCSTKFNFSFRTSAFIMAGVSLVSELSKVFSHMNYVNGVNVSDGMVIDAGALPLHICSIFIFLFFWLPFSKESKFRKYIINFFIPIGLIGATLSILMATSGVNFAKPFAYQCFIYHAVMIWYAIYLIQSKNTDLGIKSWITNLISTFALAIVMIWVNGLLAVYDTNFLFVVRPPVDNLPILNLNNGWYAYFFTLVAIGFVGITLVHLPSMIIEIKNNKKAKALATSNVDTIDVTIVDKDNSVVEVANTNVVDTNKETTNKVEDKEDSLDSVESKQKTKKTSTTKSTTKKTATSTTKKATNKNTKTSTTKSKSSKAK